MSHIARPAAGLAVLVLSTGPFLLMPSSAAADGDTKAGIEHAERQAVEPPNKARTEFLERQVTSSSGQVDRAPSVPTSPSGGGGTADAWQLALSMALGATLTGGVVLASRQVSQHQQAVAS